MFPGVERQASQRGNFHLKTVAIPLLDHIITSMKDHLSIMASSLQLGVIPSVYAAREKLIWKEPLTSTRMTCPALISTKLRRWKAWYSGMPVDLRPSITAAAIKDCDGALYPNVRILLQIACTLPVMSCECEREC